MNEALKACPFCGKQPRYEIDVDGEWIYCENEKCKYISEDSRAWNTRPLEDVLRKQLDFAIGVLEYKAENGDGEAISALAEIEAISETQSPKSVTQTD